MTVASSIRRSDAVGNGATKTYSYAFRILDDDELLVSVQDTAGVITALTKTTDYTVTGVGLYTGGTIVLVNAGQNWLDADGDLKINYKLTIRRRLPLTQQTDLRNSGDFFPEDHETQFDRGIMIALQQQDELDRSIKFPETDSPTLSASLPAASLRANKYVAFDAQGNVIASAGPISGVPVSAFMATVVDDADEVTAAATLKLSDTADTTRGDALIGYKNTGTGAAARTVHAKLDELPSILDWANQAGVEASGKDWIFMPSAQTLIVAGALAKNYWGPGSLALASGDMPGTQGDAAYGFVVLETAAAGSGQHFTFGAKVFTGTRTDTSSAPGQNHCVAGYFEAQRGAGSSDGIWAVNSVTEVYNLSGATIGYEIDVNNASGSDPGLSPANPYIGLSVVSGAAGRGGTAIVVDRNGSFTSNHWHRGLWVKEVLSRAFELTNCGAATGLWTDNVFKIRGTAASVEPVLALVPFDDTEATSYLFYLANSTDSATKGGWLKRGEISINEPNGKGTAGISIKGIANGDNIVFLQRNTDTSPTGTFMRFVNAANSTVLFDVDHASGAGDTNVLLSVAGAAAVRVTVGANDSGGVGFKLLRVPN